MARKTQHSAETVVESVNRNRGIVSKVADELRVTTQTVYNYRDRWVTVAEALEDQKNRRDDFVETKLWQAINDGNITAIIFYAKTQMKHRGYIERQELTGKDGDALTVSLTWGDNADA